MQKATGVLFWFYITTLPQRLEQSSFREETTHVNLKLKIITQTMIHFLQ